MKKPLAPAEIAAWVRSLNFSGFSIIMVLLLVMGVMIVAPGVATLLDQRRQIAQLEASVREHSETVDEVEAARDRWKDPAYIRAQARDRLFFVMPGETQLSIIDDVVITEAAQRNPSDQLTEASQDWLKSLAGSVLMAGTTAAPAEELSR